MIFMAFKNCDFQLPPQNLYINSPFVCIELIGYEYCNGNEIHIIKYQFFIYSLLVIKVLNNSYNNNVVIQYPWLQ